MNMKSATRTTLRQTLEHLEAKMHRQVQLKANMIKTLPRQQQVSATNLLHYLTLRTEDIRPLQDELHDAGLSSLASAESHILYQLQSVLQHLDNPTAPSQRAVCNQRMGRTLLQQRTEQLFGPETNPAIPHIMVTFDTDFAEDHEKVQQLLLAGMNVARINCAHDDADVWSRMITNIRQASAATGVPCFIYMDLAGPKIRTEILGKGRKKGRAEFEELGPFFLAERGTDIPPKQIVIGCSLPGIVNQLRAGERVLFDDGLFEAQVESVAKGVALLEMLRISAKKPRLKAEKGINFPDTTLRVDALSVEDRAILPFVAHHADLIGYSFVSKPEDLQALQELLTSLCAGKAMPPIILKIETREAVNQLPALLLRGMTQPVFGVMIARGDLAVEIGFERMSEIQEEILWICEAAHVPVIWATQVLENLHKSGIATRSEVTDAAHAALAECVMINKGDHTLKVIEMLKDILQRTGGHRSKKSYFMRPLGIAKNFMAEQ